MKRRSLLGLVSAAASAAAIAGCEASRASPPSSPLPGVDEWTRLRAEFDLSPDWIHLGGFLLASHPRAVREAIERHRRALDDNPVHHLEDIDHTGPVLDAAAAYMEVGRDEIALTDSTTMGLALLYTGLPLRAGDDVLTTEHDHYATHESLRLAAERSGATVRKIKLYDRPADATPAAMTAAVEREIKKETRVVAITWVHSSTGVKTPVRAIADVVAAANKSRDEASRVLLCVDGVHAFGVEDASVKELGCDFFSAGCHKWLFGPRGTGVLWGRAELWKRIRPTIPHFGRDAYRAWLLGVPPPPTTADMMTPGGFHSFEHRWALGHAFELHRFVGRTKVTSRIRDLQRQTKEGLAKTKGVTLHTPRADDASAGIITFELAGKDPPAIVTALRERRIIATTTPYATSYARVAPGLLNAPADVDAFLRELAALV